MMMRVVDRVALALSCLLTGSVPGLAAPEAPAAIERAGSEPAGAERLGPSFACPAPQDALGQLICGSPVLARDDLAFVQAYQALRQQSPAAQQKLRGETQEFSRRVRAECGLGTDARVSPAIEGGAAGCVQRAYERQRDKWLAALTGAGLEEASRDLAEQVALQRHLKLLGLLPPAEPVNGVYGSVTRAAIVTFQQTMGLPTTGLLGDKEAAALMRQADQRGERSAPPARRSAWETFQSGVTPLGLATSMSLAPDCVVAFDVRNPDALAQAAREFAQKRGNTDPLDDRARLFAAEMAFMRGTVATGGVQAFYASQPGGDRCRFEAKGYTTDIYGRDVAQPLFSFVFDRATYGKIVWSRFNADNLPKVALSFEYGSYARDRLPRTQTAPVELAGAPSTPRVGKPAESPDNQVTVARGDPTERPLTDKPVAEKPASDKPVAAAPPGPTGAWSSDAMVTTRPFHAEGAWELHWSSTGWFVAVLHEVGADNGSVAAQTSIQASSTAVFPKGGDFYLELIGAEPWTAKLSVAAPEPVRRSSSADTAGAPPQ